MLGSAPWSGSGRRRGPTGVSRPAATSHPASWRVREPDAVRGGAYGSLTRTEAARATGMALLLRRRVEQAFFMSSPPAAAGVRQAWADLPEHIRATVEARAGATIVAARDQRGGFSPGVAARLLLADGSRLFVKALGPSGNPNTAAMHRGEARTLAALPPGVPTPRLLWSHDTAGAPAEGVDAVLCAFAGMLAEHCRRPLSRACRPSARSSARMLVARPNGSPGAPGGAVQFGRWGRRLVGCHIACGRVRSRAPIPSTYIT